MTAITPTPAASAQATPPPREASAPPPSAPVRPPQAPILSNPAVRLDARTSMVVLEFYDSAGDVRVKIPSERELRAYQQGQDPLLPGAPARIEAVT
jgi:hypothetical protein